MTVELQDAGARLPELPETAAGGEEVILVHDGKPIARLSV
jgi:antitoxin (DNA-binding transcriptional repressor) of toxin-antitoxin stability system